MRRSYSSQLVAAILVNSVYEMKNYPINLVNTVLSPLSFLVVIDFVSRGALIGQAIEGGLIMSMFQSGMSLQGDISHLKNDFKLQDMLVSSPASPAVYVIGMAASEIIYNLPALAILVVLGGVYIHPGAVQALELTAALVLMFLTSITIGFMFATLSSDIVQSFAWSRLLTTIFTAITPVYYPITYIPLPVQVPGVPLADHLRGGDNAERGRVAQAERGRRDNRLGDHRRARRRPPHRRLPERQMEGIVAGPRNALSAGPLNLRCLVAPEAVSDRHV